MVGQTLGSHLGSTSTVVLSRKLSRTEKRTITERQSLAPLVFAEPRHLVRGNWCDDGRDDSRSDERRMGWTLFTLADHFTSNAGPSGLSWDTATRIVRGACQQVWAQPLEPFSGSRRRSQACSNHQVGLLCLRVHGWNFAGLLQMPLGAGTGQRTRVAAKLCAQPSPTSSAATTVLHGIRNIETNPNEPAPHRIAYMNLAVAAGQFAAAAQLTPIMLFSFLQLGQSMPALHIGISLPPGSANPISNCDARFGVDHARCQSNHQPLHHPAST